VASCSNGAGESAVAERSALGSRLASVREPLAEPTRSSGRANSCSTSSPRVRECRPALSRRNNLDRCAVCRVHATLCICALRDR
jgi:hypothetical protein